jgi:hypothetical protein
VSERWLTMGEIVEAQKEGRVSSLLPCACDHSAFPMLPVKVCAYVTCCDGTQWCFVLRSKAVVLWPRCVVRVPYGCFEVITVAYGCCYTLSCTLRCGEVT